MDFPPTAAFFAEHVAASAVRPAGYDWITDPVNANMRVQPPTLCPAVCTTHQRGCALHLAPVDEHVTPKHRDPAWHLCNGGGMPHDFYETPKELQANINRQEPKK